jgi:hypothetical protein
VVLRDRVGDVWRENTDAGTLTRLKRFPTADVVAATVEHRPGAVVVRMRFVDLRRVKRQQAQVATIKTPNRKFAAYLFEHPASRDGRDSLEDYGPPSEGSTKRCPGLSHRVNYHTETAVLRVPRQCLNNPRWVRLQLEDYTVVGKPMSLSATFFHDNPHNDRAEPKGFTRRLYP